MNFQSVCQKLESLRKSEDPRNRSGIQELISSLDIKSGEVIVVAGTNGKGSTAHCLEALCRGRGESTVLFTSPHLLKTTERIRLNGIEISEGRFIAVYLAERSNIREAGLSHFEAVLWMALQVFVQEGVDRLILEVGLGGLHDATHQVAHDYAVVTSIGLDHQDILGKTYPEIAAQKFAIGDLAKSLFFGSLPSELDLWLTEHRQPHWRASDPLQEQDGYLLWRGGEIKSPLPGRTGLANFQLALTCAEAWFGKITQAQIDAVQVVQLPGRWQHCRYRGREIVLSLAHNLPALEQVVLLAGQEIGPGGRVYFIFGCSRGRNPTELIRPLREAGEVIGVDGGFLQVEPIPPDLEISVCPSPETALERSVGVAAPGDLIVVTGSTYLVSEVLKIIGV